jgi:zona occludens toxin (predicted ATPase)
MLTKTAIARRRPDGHHVTLTLHRHFLAPDQQMVFSPPSLSRDIKATKSNALPVLASLL